MSTLRKVLLAMLLVSLTGSAFGAGTFASFSATTTNVGSTFASGTLVLSEKVNSGSACLSTGGGTTVNLANSFDCGVLFNLSSVVQKPGATATVDIDLENAGNLAGTLALRFTGTGANGLCATTDAAGTYKGTDDLCITTDSGNASNVLNIDIQEYVSGAARTAETTGTGTCRFGTNIGASGACTKDRIGALDTYRSGTGGVDLDMSSIAATTTRYFRIHLEFPGAADNQAQGRLVTWGMTWKLLQT